ncbi:hypothetical protein QE410_003184 [Microbacterium sp. SORGH_AS 1204]|uniref:CBU_0592 family membrane protein n=1 Tax=Microbacterium sp. SORGH_AS_1204 TaxID=3041785 RepID=UPI00278F6AE3|nr:hypothetical protein [Microbacterium sp. SORGH_AS_1204]MDQ1138385.1 hypothetical protein [Microbacterium sp. SORGH_AS_1204]
MSSTELANIIGLVGVALVVVTYLLLQIGRVRVDQLRYSLLNAVASVLVLVSLAAHWNLASVVIEGFWLLISVYGCLKWVRTRRRRETTAS